MELLHEIRAQIDKIKYDTGGNDRECLETAFTAIENLLTTENPTAAPFDSSETGNMINMIENLQDDESFESYMCKVIAVSNFVKSVPSLTLHLELEEVTKALWKALNKALWTLLQQITMLLSKLADDRKYQEESTPTPPLSSDPCYILISLFLCLESLQQIFINTTSSLIAQEISLLVDSLAISFLCQGLNQSLLISGCVMLTSRSMHEQNNQLRTLGSNKQRALITTVLTEEVASLIDINLLPYVAYNREFTIVHALCEYLGSQSPSFTSVIATLQESLITTLQHTFHTSHPSHDSAIAKEYLERVFSSVHIAIAKHWDLACGDHFLSDQIASIALLSSFFFMQHRKVLECNIAMTSSSLTAIVAVCMRLLDHRYDDTAHTLGLYLLHQGVGITSSSMHLKPIAQWISPHLLQRRSIVIGSLSQLLVVSVLLDMWLCCCCSFPAISISCGSELQLQQVSHELLDSLLRDVLKDYNHDKLWHEWTVLIKPLRTLSLEIITCYLTLIHECIMHSMNVFHLPLQRLLITYILPELLFARISSELMGAYAHKICTELSRLLIFYTRKLTPDLSLADEEQQNKFADEIKTVLLGQYRVKCQKEYAAWKTTMSNALKAKNVKSSSCNKLEREKNSVKFITELMNGLESL